jgi:hypothetical protein
MTTPGTTRRARKIEQTMQDKGLGRMILPDVRDRRFMMRAVVPPKRELPASKMWPLTSGVLDQGSTPQCVAYSWTQFLLATPTVHRAGSLGAIASFARDLYQRAQRIDEWPGENYDGTSVRAGAKVLVAQGRIADSDTAQHGGYRWAFNAAEARDFVLGIGPVVFGTWWTEEMFVPDAAGYIKPGGDYIGGHAYLVVGYSKPRNAFRIVNSWGASWGQSGRAWMAFADADTLIRDYGEACSALEVRPPTV